MLRRADSRLKSVRAMGTRARKTLASTAAVAHLASWAVVGTYYCWWLRAEGEALSARQLKITKLLSCLPFQGQLYSLIVVEGRLLRKVLLQQGRDFLLRQGLVEKAGNRKLLRPCQIGRVQRGSEHHDDNGLSLHERQLHVGFQKASKIKLGQLLVSPSLHVCTSIRSACSPFSATNTRSATCSCVSKSLLRKLVVLSSSTKSTLVRTDID
jgi:hypothetical protein